MSIFELNIFGFTLAPSYYGLMYVLGFVIGYFILKKRTSSLSNLFKTTKNEALDDLLFYIFIGVILGGRLGYVIFYDLSHYLNNLTDIIKIWEGGMSFHGGVIGVIIAMLCYAKKYKINFLSLTDEVTSILPIGLGLGRIGNYINKELLGYSPYNGFLAIQKNGVGYFPSPLLEAILEGLLLFIILTVVYKYKKFNGQIASLFLILYGLFRLFVEYFFRTPDAHIGYIIGNFSTGALLSIVMVIGGGVLYGFLSRK